MKSIVFDMDGVLFDTERLCLESWTAVADQNGIPDMEAFFPRCIGRNATDTKALALDYYGADFDYDGFRAKTSAWFRDSVQKNGLPIKTGAREILEYLQKENWRIALASSTKYQTVTSQLEQAGLIEYFSVIVTGDMVEHSKPEPDIYRIACRELGAVPAKTYAVEDSPNGIRAAYRAGMKAIMVPDLVPADEEMVRLSHRIFTDLPEVRRYLETEASESSSDQANSSSGA